MTKIITTLTLLLVVAEASASTQTLRYESTDRTCPLFLELEETYVGRELVTVKVSHDDPKDKYIPDIKFCENIKGETVDAGENDGSVLTCLAESLIGNEYDLSIRYEVPGKYQDDYGFQSEYRIQKTAEGVRAYWGKNRSYDGAPIYCDYGFVE